MKTPTRSLRRRLALFALGGVLTLPLAPLATAGSPDSPTMQSLADSAAPLPLKATCKKVKSGENAGLYTLHLKNTSDQAITVTASIVVSVPVHNSPKIREEPAHAIKAGKSWSIKQLSAGDKVTVKADGFAPLEVTVQ